MFYNHWTRDALSRFRTREMWWNEQFKLYQSESTQIWSKRAFLPGAGNVSTDLAIDGYDPLSPVPIQN